MKIVHLNTNDNIDGAGRAAYRLHKGLRGKGIDSYMFVQRKRTSDSTVVAYNLPRSLLERLSRRLLQFRLTLDRASYRSSRPSGYERFSPPRTLFRGDLVAQIPPADVLNLHSIADFVDYPSFFERNKTNPIVWTLHDMEPFTAGCHYDFGCDKYTTQCAACPQLGSRQRSDLAFRAWKSKQLAYSQIDPGRLHLVALNRWMVGEVQRSAILRQFPLTIIPNGLDVEVFAPRDRGFARQVLGIPDGARVVLFVSSSVKTRRKGFAFLTQAFAQIKDFGNMLLLSVGEGTPELTSSGPHIHMDVIGNDRLLSLVYSAADAFVIPSLQDNLPNTVLESFACGTPVVGFAVGGVHDLVSTGETGFLAPVEDATALAQAVCDLLSDRDRWHTMSVRCRQRAIQEYSLDVQAERYARLYEQVGSLKTGQQDKI